MNLIEKNFSIEGMYNRCHGDVPVLAVICPRGILFCSVW